MFRLVKERTTASVYVIFPTEQANDIEPLYRETDARICVRLSQTELTKKEKLQKIQRESERGRDVYID